MANSQLDLGEWTEDVCEICGAHVGYGIEAFHLSRCDEHSDEKDNDDFA